MEGTLRTLDPAVRERVLKRLKEMLEGLEVTHQVKAELQTVVGYPLLVNHPEVVRFVEAQVPSLLGPGCLQPGPPRMGSEDFAYFLERFPGILLRLGCHDPGRLPFHGLHSPFFDFDERVLSVGVRLFTHLLMHYEDRQ